MTFIAKLVSEDLLTPGYRASTMSVWPNPASLVVSINLPDGLELARVTVFDGEGRVVVTGHDNVINVFGLAAGVYCISAVANDMVFKGKFIKQ